MKAATVLATLLLVPAGLIGQNQPPAQPQHQHEHQATGESNPAMMQECKAMMARHQEMMAGMHAADAELKAKLEAVNKADETTKVAAIADFLNAAFSQQQQARQMLMENQGQMMRHMMGHMPADMQQKMSDCPMMKQMMGDQSEAETDHSSHHPE